MQITWRDANGNRLPGSFHPERTGRVQGERDLFGRYGKPAEMPVSAGPFIEEGHINEDDEGAYSAMAAEALGIRGQEPWWALTDWIIANWSKIQSSAPSPVKPPVQPPAQPPSPPPVSLHDTFDGQVWAQEFVRQHGGDVELMHVWFANAIMAGYDHARATGLDSGLHPLSPASVRAEELRVLFSAFTTDWPAIRPFAVEGVRLYRRLRAKLGDTREIPAEDR